MIRWLLVSLVLLGSVGIAPAYVFSDDPSRPNVVIFIADDLSQLDTSPYGEQMIRTPNMQRLADEGMTFTRAYVASPSCAPSRAALLTGLMPARNGSEANHSKPRAEITKWPAYFQRLGYEVAAFGKVSHYRHTADYGFDRFAFDTFHNHQGIAAAIEFLKSRDRAKPLCLFVGTNWPHVPWPEKDLGYDGAALKLPEGSVDTEATRQWRSRYAAAVTKADEHLGQILAAAEASLSTNTVFLMTADHGAQWPFAKWNCYESGLRVPLLVRWPSKVKPGSRTDAMVSWIDLLPTMIDAAGGIPPKEVDGRSFLSVMLGKSTAHREAIFATHSGDGRFNVYPIRSIRRGDWKLIFNLHPEYQFTTHIDLPGDLGQRSYFETWEVAAKTDRSAAEIVKRYHVRPMYELYDLASDPTEQNNLAAEAQHADQLTSLKNELEAWMREQGDKRTVFATPRM